MSRLTSKITAVLCSLLLLLTTACNHPETSSETVSGIINTEYTREKVTSQAFVGSYDYFAATQLWAAQFVEKNYQSYGPSNIKAVFISGFALDSGELADFEVGAQVYDVTFTAKKDVPALTQNADGSYTLRLQAVYYLNSENRCVLSGFAYEDEIIDDSRGLYDFLKTDTRLTMQVYPYPEVDDGVRTNNLTQALKQRGLKRLSELYCIGKDKFFFLSCGKNAAAGTVDLNFFDLSTGQNFADNEAMHLSGVSAYFVDMTDGEIKVVYNYAEGGAYYCNTFTYDGAVRGKFQPYHFEEESAAYEVGKSTILEENASLYLLDDDGDRTLLLQGNPAGDDSSTAYRFCGQVDKDSFLFVCYGYEWIEHWGIYDLNTRSAILGADYELPLGAYHGMIYLENVDGPEHVLRSVTPDDLNASGLEVFRNTGDHYVLYAFSEDGNYLAYCLQQDQLAQVKVFDLRAQTVVHEFSVRFSAGFSRLYFGDNDTLHLFSTNHALYDYYAFTYHLPQTTVEE